MYAALQEDERAGTPRIGALLKERLLRHTSGPGDYPTAVEVLTLARRVGATCSERRFEKPPAASVVRGDFRPLPRPGQTGDIIMELSRPARYLIRQGPERGARFYPTGSTGPPPSTHGSMLMNKIGIACSALVCLFAFGVASADEDASILYKTRCQGCHGPDGGLAPVKGVAPIKGQNADDLLHMLEGYKNGSFGGPQKRVMEGIVKRLSDEQLKSLADYSSKL